MKIRRLSETDLARFGVMQRDERKVALRKHKFGRPPHDYDPVRLAQPDILNRQTQLFGDTSRTAWQHIERSITSRAETESERDYNLAVAKSLYSFSIDREIVSRDRPLSVWTIGFGQSVKFWPNYISVLRADGGGRPIAEIPFHDYRLSKRLNKEARRFVFSVMHERTRALDDDLGNVELAIYQFNKAEDGSRILRRHCDRSIVLYSFDELNEMISDTYQQWFEVLEERQEQTRRTGTGGPSNPMGF